MHFWHMFPVDFLTFPVQRPESKTVKNGVAL